eukprot:scaffold16330_cov172-Amphora_coffeaeformis.AAC.2
MVQGETQEFGGSSLDLTSQYYDGPEAEKLRFVQYCEKELGKSASNGTVSSLVFLDLLQKYCYFRNMRGNICRAADALTFASLPSDVQLAFVNDRCSGPREARLECLEYLVDDDEILFVPEEWKYGICSAAYPLAVSYDTSTANMEEHVFSTKGLGEGSTSVLKTNRNKASPATSEIVFNTDSQQKKKTGGSAGPQVLQKSYSEPSPADELQATSIKSGGGAHSDLFMDSYSNQAQSDQTQNSVSSHNELPTESKTSTSNGKKKKRSSKSRKQNGPPSLSITQKTASPALRVTRQPSISPTKMPTVFSEGSSTTADTDSQFAPTLFPTVYTTEITLSSPSPSPSKTTYSIQAVSEQSIVPYGPINGQDSSDKSINKYEGVALILGILFAPVVFFLFVKAYQRHRDPRRGTRGLALFEDFSVISESSAILVAVGTKFKKSDDSSIVSDLESNSSSAFMGHRGLSQRIWHAFNKLYEYMEGDDISMPPPLPPGPPPPEISKTFIAPPKTEEAKTLPKAIVKPYREIFRPNQSSSGGETIGVLKPDRGTLLLPSDQIYIQEFAPSKDNSEGTIPIIYQLDPSITHTTSNIDVKQNFQAIHPATPATKTGSPDNCFGAPFYPLAMDIKHTHSGGDGPVVVAQSTSSWDDSTTAVKSKPIRVDVLREENSENDFRIVGLAREDSEASNVASQMSVPFDEEQEKPHSHRVAFANDVPSTLRNKLVTPSTFQKLSKELDEMMMEAPSTDLQQKALMTPRRTVSSGNLFSVSSMSRSTSSSWSCDTPVIGNSLFWPHQKTYTMDVLGEQCHPSPSPRPAIRNSLATGSWIDSIDASSISGCMSEGPSIASAQPSCDGVELTLTETGNVAVTTKQTSADKRLEMINMYPLD